MSISYEAAAGLKTVVTRTLTPTKAAVLVRIEQSGFRPDEERNYQRANYDWQRYLGGLEQVVAALLVKRPTMRRRPVVTIAASRRDGIIAPCCSSGDGA